MWQRSDPVVSLEGCQARKVGYCEFAIGNGDQAVPVCASLLLIDVLLTISPRMRDYRHGMQKVARRPVFRYGRSDYG